MQIQAVELQEGDTIPGLDNAYVVEVETGNGYLSYPRSSGGQGCAMPEDTIIVTYHDADGGENYMLLNPEGYLTIRDR